MAKSWNRVFMDKPAWEGMQAPELEVRRELPDGRVEVRTWEQRGARRVLRVAVERATGRSRKS